MIGNRRTSYAVLPLLVALLSAAGSLHVFGYTWAVPNIADWRIDQEDGAPVLHLLVGREPPPGPRRPFQFAVADTAEFGSVTIEADARPLQRSLMIVYAYRDAAHFDYAHLSIDTAVKQPHHNGIFHVYGGERVRISPEGGPAAFAASDRWYHIRVAQDGKTGTVQVTVDGRMIPALHAVDMSLTTGKAGIGSFDETADFKNVTIRGVALGSERR